MTNVSTAQAQTARVFLGRIDRPYRAVVDEAFAWLQAGDLLAGRKVFVKANLTFPEFRPGVMTTPEALDAVLGALTTLGCRVWFGEADSGGYNPFSMDDVFARMGLAALGSRHGATLVNLSRLPQATHSFDTGGRRYSFRYASLFDEIDMTISMPVPKIHMNTGLSLAFKNQWGCMSFPAERLALHPVFAPALAEINRKCKLGMAMMDGTYGLDRSGPLAGDVVELGWMMASFSPGAVCNTAARLMGLDPFTRAPHLEYLRRMGWVPDIDRIEFNHNWHEFMAPRKFHLSRAWTDYPGLIAFHSAFWNRVAYFSPVADLLHRLLYVFRNKFY